MTTRTTAARPSEMTSEFPDCALPAWQAYLAMDESKQKHFGLLEELENKYKAGGNRTLAESARLQELLREHDENVREFRRLMKELQVRDIEAHATLLKHITLWNVELGATAKRS